MNTEQAASLMRDCLGEVAPESRAIAVAPDADYREIFAIDSLDFLRLIELLSERSGVRIDEEDYPRLATLGEAADFLSASSTATR